MKRRIFDDELHVHFITSSCYRRRRLFDHDRSKKIVIGVLGSQLTQQKAICVGFVVMPDHVHALVWFSQPGQLSHFMKQWKQRSSVQIKKTMRSSLSQYSRRMSLSDPIWQPRYYPFNIYSFGKLEEKLDYMHRNPVRAGLVERVVDWPWSSARYYLLGRSVGLPIGWPSGI